MLRIGNTGPRYLGGNRGYASPWAENHPESLSGQWLKYCNSLNSPIFGLHLLHANSPFRFNFRMFLYRIGASGADWGGLVVRTSDRSPRVHGLVSRAPRSSACLGLCGRYGSVRSMAADALGATRQRNVTQSNNCYGCARSIKVTRLGVDDQLVVAAVDRVAIMRKGQSQQHRPLVAEADDV